MGRRECRVPSVWSPPRICVYPWYTQSIVEAAPIIRLPALTCI